MAPSLCARVTACASLGARAREHATVSVHPSMYWCAPRVLCMVRRHAHNLLLVSVHSACMHACLPARTCMNMHACMHAPLYALTHVWMHAFVRAFIYTHLCMYVCMSLHVFLQTSVHACMRAALPACARPCVFACTRAACTDAWQVGSGQGLDLPSSNQRPPTTATHGRPDAEASTRPRRPDATGPAPSRDSPSNMGTWLPRGRRRGKRHALAQN